MPEQQSARRIILFATLHGIAAWVTYWLISCSYASILPRLARAETVLMPFNGRLSLLLLGIYIVIGLFAGAAAGVSVVIFRWRSASLSAAATFSVVLGFMGSLAVTAHVRPAALLTLLAALPFSLAILVDAVSVRWPRHLAFLTNRWTVCFLLLGVPWVALDLLSESTRTVKALGALVFLAAGCAGAWTCQRLVRRLLRGKRTEPIRNLVYVGAGALVVSGVLFLVDRPLPAGTLTGKTLVRDRSRPNIILITMDTVRADHLSLYGYPRRTSPNLSRLADSATVYVRATAPSDLTLPSHASLFTGMYASWHGAYCGGKHGFPFGRPLDPGYLTLAEILRRKGYRTAGVVANHAYLGSAFGLDQGFESYYDQAPIPMLEGSRSCDLRRGVRDLLSAFVSTSEFDLQYLRAEDINSRAIAVLQGLRERPFFLFLNYMDAHTPYVPPPPFDTLFAGKDHAQTHDRILEVFRDVLQRKRRISAKERDHLESQYDGGIAYIDSCLGKLIEELKRSGLYDHSLLIITADHGEAFGERGLIEHGVVSVYQDQIHIPMIVKYPGQGLKKIVADPVSLVDLMPTVLDILGEPPRAGVPGRSLVDAAEGASRDLLSEAFPSGEIIEIDSRFDRVSRAVISGRWKLITSTAGKNELYDLSADPAERHDVAGANSAASGEIAGRLNRMLAGALHASGKPADLDKETVRRLRSLGYIH